MFYPIKRYILFRIRELEEYIQTLKRHHEIAKAYQTSFKVKIKISPRFFWTTLTFLLILAVIGGLITLRKPIISKISAISLQIKESANNRKSKKAKEVIKAKEVTRKIIAKEKKSQKNSLKTKKELEDPKTVLSSISPKKMRYFIFANKAFKTMYLFENKGKSWEINKKFDIAIGKDPERKRREGDLRTPEGQYFIVGRQEKNELNRIYGPLAYVLNYPNTQDKKEGRTGTGIWIHGTAPDTIPFQTKGCLELSNSELSNLGKILKRGIGTPVLIVSDSTIKEPLKYPDYSSVLDERENIIRTYLNHKEEFRNFLDAWSNAWSSRNIEKYQVLYDKEDFKSRGMKWEAWMEYKEKTFNNYSLIEIGINNFFLSDFSESTAVLKFVQSYKSDRFQSVNGKKLTVIRRDSGWKILNEASIPKEELLL